jgi:hypothetical protein
MTAMPDRLQAFLRRTHRRVLGCELARSAALAVSALAGVVLLAAVADAVLTLPAWALAAVDCTMAALLPVLAFWMMWVRRRNAYDQRRMARLVERKLGIRDSQLINAVDFAAGRHERTASRELLAATLARAQGRAGTLSPAGLAPVAQMKQAISVALAVLVGGAVLYLAMPGLFQSALLRYLHPGRDLPAFTLVEFDVSTVPAKVYAGRPAAIHVTLRGHMLPSQANVVFADGAGRQSVPMVRLAFAPPGQAAAGADNRRFALKIDRPDGDRDFFIDTPAGRSTMHHLTVLPVPRFQEVSVRYDFPDYTGFAPSWHRLETPALRAIRGTTATLSVRSNLPLALGRLTLRASESAGEAAPCAGGVCVVAGAATRPAAAPSGDANAPAAAAGDSAPAAVIIMQPVPGEPGVVRGQFPLNCSGRFRIELVAAEGVEGNEPLDGSITCLDDQPPTVEFEQPATDVIAPANWKVPVTISAADDVRVSRIALHRSVNGWGPWSIDLPLDAPSPRLARAEYVFDLPALGARPGDVIAYCATAWDNYPGGLHSADTARLVIRVVSQEDYVTFLRMRYRMEQVLEEIENYRRRLEELRKLGEELAQQYEKMREKIGPDGEKAAEEDRRDLADLAVKQAQYERLAQDLASDMFKRARQQEIYDFERAYSEMLAAAAAGLQERAGQSRGHRDRLEGFPMTGFSKPGIAAYVKDGAELFQDQRQQNARAREQVAKTDKEMEAIRQADELLALVERLQAIAGQQRELADRLAIFRNKENLGPSEQIRAKRMADEQSALERDLQETIQQMDDLAPKAGGNLPKMSASVLKLAGLVRQLKVDRDQRDAARLAAAGSGRYAHVSAESAAQKLESLMRECQGGTSAGAAGDDLDQALGLTKAALGQSLQQLSMGRGIPGMGREGQGRGEGGYYGSAARVSLVGPRGGSGDGARPRTASGAGRGGSGREGAAGSAAERIDAGAAGRGASVGQGGMPGVPMRYRPLAESYFRRLAEESK